MVQINFSVCVCLSSLSSDDDYRVGSDDSEASSIAVDVENQSDDSSDL